MGIIAALCGSFCGFVVNRDGIQIPSKRQNLQQIYTREIGVRELTGKNDGKRVQEYLHAVNLQGNLSYCSAFVCFCLEKAGITNPKNGWTPALFPQKRLIWVRNKEKSGLGAMQGLTTYNLLRTTPITGDVFGLFFQELKRIGHCGFVDSWDDIWCITVEANTNDIRAGPGQGVFRKKRLVKTIYKVADWVKTTK
ncbi:hypothetical protein SAMN05216436_101253 [bacterium A37T11]|nr:hypothetical protein SAMN05216436_101253 [bacterium A37T11]